MKRLLQEIQDRPVTPTHCTQCPEDDFFSSRWFNHSACYGTVIIISGEKARGTNARPTWHMQVSIEWSRHTSRIIWNQMLSIIVTRPPPLKSNKPVSYFGHIMDNVAITISIILQLRPPFLHLGIQTNIFSSKSTPLEEFSISTERFIYSRSNGTVYGLWNVSSMINRVFNVLMKVIVWYSK